MKKDKPQIIFEEALNPWHFRKCSVCKKHIKFWQKRVLIIAKFPDKIKVFSRCIKCHKKKMKKLTK